VTIKDSGSTSGGNLDGTTLCGSRVYSLINAYETTLTSVTATSATIRLATTDDAKITTLVATGDLFKNVTLKACL